MAFWTFVVTIAGMKRYDYVLFDWDGTIARTLDIWMEALKEILGEKGYNFTSEQIGADYGLFRSRFSNLGEDALNGIIDEALTLSNKNMPSVKLYEGHLELISLLKQNNKRLGIVTTSAHSVIDQLLNKHDMAKSFDVLIGGDDVLNQKPHAEPIIKAIDVLSAVKSRTIMVGDSDKDIISAQNAGIDSILFYPPEHSHFHDITYLKSLKPTYVAGSFQEISSLLT